ncbi:class I SAM-dependent methyltransferase [Streptomyces sp. NA04227]|uniref:class I SAM-dependent methyltransferase n=1 Tax=Streptomyces sp. NA04227 TaxID=2742136 RepID=UPI00159122B4|nr:class I SAM-dependent methyltransferase [Streptomyces sp. NA04227]QKW06815.1 class I SAM-dependent methyltransferase [Streptomyces sp. NA04227]
MTSATTELPRPASLAEVKGWFRPVDQQLFRWFLSRQLDHEQRGDLLEMGAYMGKSAIFMASYLRSSETFTVCDLFDSPAPDAANTKEMNKSYSTLTRRAFEANYLSFHEKLPEVVQAPTSVVPEHVTDGSCRFVHVDASHLYEHVHGDIAAAHKALVPEGIVSLDDYRAEHCPGVAFATWEAVAVDGLHPICATGTKFYGTWGDPEPVREALLAWLKGRGDMWHEVQGLGEERLIRIDGKKAATPDQPESKHTAAAPPAPEPKPAPVAEPAAARPAMNRPSRARRLAKDILPPIVTRAVRRKR